MEVVAKFHEDFRVIESPFSLDSRENTANREDMLYRTSIFCGGFAYFENYA